MTSPPPAPASNGGATITGFNVYRGTTPVGESPLTSLGAVTSYTDNTASNGTTYFYTVSAVNSAGAGQQSSEVSATPQAPMVSTPPQSLKATAGNAVVNLSWTAPASNGGSAITGYNVYRGTSSAGEGFLTSVTSRSLSDTAVTNGTTYFYKVTAVNVAGESTPSSEVSATPSVPSTVPSAPQGLVAKTSTTNGVALSWSAPASNGGSAVTGYWLYRITRSSVSAGTFSCRERRVRAPSTTAKRPAASRTTTKWPP